MSDLHLTDEQVEELSSMGPLGEETAHELGLWRDANDPPWSCGDLEGFSYGVTCKSRGNVDFEVVRVGHGGDADAICHARNTAELRAALVYWLEKKHLNKEAWYALNYESPVSPEWSGWWDLAHIDRKLEAIAAALKEMRNA